MTDKPIISGAGIELRSLVHVSDREFCQSRNGEMMMTVEGFHRMTDLHEVLNDLSSRLRELEATCARQQSDIDRLMRLRK